MRNYVLCERVIDGKQCTNFAKHCHHVRGLRSHNEDLTDEDQCRAVCHEHHSASDGDVGHEVYVR